MTHPIRPGDIYSISRTYTNDDVLAFAELTGDKGRHHMEPDEHGRLMVHGLMTASIGSKLAGDIHFIGRELHNEYLRPVFSGDTITCEVTVESVEQKDGYRKVALRSIYRNQHGKEVIVGTTNGVVRD